MLPLFVFARYTHNDMLAKENRLRRDKEFKQVFASGKSVFDSACGIKFSKNELGVSRFAVVVGTKVSKSAVKRNRVRRQYREIIRLKLDEIKEGYDVILLVGKESLEMEYEQKEKKLVKVLKKAELV